MLSFLFTVYLLLFNTNMGKKFLRQFELVKKKYIFLII